MRKGEDLLHLTLKAHIFVVKTYQSPSHIFKFYIHEQKCEHFM